MLEHTVARLTGDLNQYAQRRHTVHQIVGRLNADFRDAAGLLKPSRANGSSSAPTAEYGRSNGRKRRRNRRLAAMATPFWCFPGASQFPQSEMRVPQDASEMLG